MGELVDLTSYRQNKKPPPAVTWNTVIAESTDLLMAEWEKLARHNRLNDYFKRQFSSLIDFASTVNFMSDLNEVATLELKLELFPIVYYPGTMSKRQIGWAVQFKLEDILITTPDLASEAYARCFALLLFIKVKGAALQAGLMK